LRCILLFSCAKVECCSPSNSCDDAKRHRKRPNALSYRFKLLLFTKY